jgi:IMP dehydrogenase
MSKFRNSIVYLGYEDVFIFPNGSSVSSRKDVDTTTVLHGSNSHIQVVLEVPVISANMDTVTEDKMAIAMRNSGGIGALHRFMSIEENVEMYKRVKDGIDKSKNIEAGHECFVSIGVNPSDYMERTRRLYAAGARLFVIDIAHGHSDHMRNTIKWLRKEFKNEIFIMAGNVATPEGVSELDQAGADCVKIGVGPGAVCTTKDVTGVTVPIFSCVEECAEINDTRGVKIPLIADGGARYYGDIAKALGAGASAVMSGYFFAGSHEIPEAAYNMDHSTGKLKAIYRGMASSGAMKKIKADNLPTPEGRTTEIDSKGQVSDIMKDIKGGLQSSFSYVGARDIENFKGLVTFGRRR